MGWKSEKWRYIDEIGWKERVESEVIWLIEMKRSVKEIKYLN